ncbi:Do family serine endopeptidase [Ancylobacter dichloromethanicus]|uniref:Probable periplasmic serine endoprotease DegP-like n=1 Tax=Ancylobacter dichloromethanicus TaxID=518825 RepID=A0A9W6MXD6_9HYPH|nr:Do family serine endopeptidase [Ancylobacter dichloromethanicus]MBS7556172.1 Do family serine endopeptidase [Ancylobacter dichloromethanicus]GLK69926.1 serine peptidase [Ancylobacter dichloromethanicus]
MSRTAPNLTRTPASSTLRKSRSRLLAGVFTLALAGGAVGAFVLPEVISPAQAQLSTSQPAGTFSFADIVEKVSPAVVSVKVKKDEEQVASNDEDGMGQNIPPQIERFMRRFGFGPGGPGGPDMGPRRGPGHRGVVGQGSGFFISSDGYVVTNNHVVDGATEVDVTTTDGKSYTAKVIGTDPRTDVALLKVKGKGDFPWVKLAEKAPRVGDWVVAVGNPFGLGGTVTAGIVSARGRDIGSGPYDDFIQIDAPINRGNSGGPTFSLDGDVIGMNTAIVSPSGGNVGIAFAIPSETVSEVVEALKNGGEVARGYVGVQIQPVSDEVAEALDLKQAEGALIAQVQPGTPGEKAGLKPGDVVTAIDGENVKDSREMSREIASKKPGTVVKLSVLRDGKSMTIPVTLEQLPTDVASAGKANADDGETDGKGVPRLGLSLAPAKGVAGAGDIGVVVTEVDPNGPAAERGIKAGDVILDVGGKPVMTPAEVRDGLATAKKDNRKAVLMRVKSEQGTRFVAISLGDQRG